MNLFGVDDAVRGKVLQIFDRTEKTAMEDVAVVKQWLQTQPHLPEIMDERKILNFLIMNKFSVEVAKQKIDMYYAIRHITPEFYRGFNPDDDTLKHFLKSTYCCVHPKAVEPWYRVFFFKNRFKDDFDLVTMMLQGINIADVRLFEDFMVGEILVLDMENVSAFDMRKMTPTLIAKIFAVYEKVYRLRLRGFYLINSPSYANILVNLLKQFLKPKLFERVHVDTGIDTLKDILSQEDLPKDYGGDGPSLEQLQDLTVKKLCEYVEWFRNFAQLKSNEKLRPGKLNNDDILGFHGTFKKLDLD